MADILLHDNEGSKVNCFWKNTKNMKILTKIMTFQKILTFVTSDFLAFLETSICAW